MPALPRVLPAVTRAGTDTRTITSQNHHHNKHPAFSISHGSGIVGGRFSLSSQQITPPSSPVARSDSWPMGELWLSQLLPSSTQARS